MALQATRSTRSSPGQRPRSGPRSPTSRPRSAAPTHPGQRAGTRRHGAHERRDDLCLDLDVLARRHPRQRRGVRRDGGGGRARLWRRRWVRTRPRRDLTGPGPRLEPMRIARFTTGEDPAYGLVDGSRREDRRDHGGPALPADRAHRNGARHRRRAAARAGHPAQQGDRHRPQLRRPRQGDGRRGPRRADDVPHPEHRGRRPRRPGRHAAADVRGRLRGRARRRHRPAVQGPRARGRPDGGLRLHRRQRRHGPRPAAR